MLQRPRHTLTIILALSTLVLLCMIGTAGTLAAANLEARTGPDRGTGETSLPEPGLLQSDVEVAEECGTIFTPEQQAYELSLDRSTWLIPRAKLAADYYVPITFHVVRRSDATGGITEKRLNIALRDLNAQFEQVGITFFRERIAGALVTHYINSDLYYYDADTQSERDALRQEGPVANTINVWWIPYSPVSQSTFTTTAIQGIIMWNAHSGYPANPSTLAHEVGHYLDLYHTHQTSSGVECPDGSNCATAGDLLCDTPADPRLTNKVTLCNYIGNDTLPTGCGGTYDPPVDNLMSYSGAPCRDVFTPEQIAKMIFTLTTARLAELQAFDSTDTDGDGIFDVADICPAIPNPSQEDSDNDHIGDVCDNCPLDSLNDIDGDGICGDVDNCPSLANVDQADSDLDGIGDVCGCSVTGKRWYGESNRDIFGWRVRSAGDVNADGADDFIVGAENADAPDTNSGAVYVYSGLDQALLYRFTGEEAWSQFGSSVASAGDLNGDGHSDVIVGAWNYNGAAGKVYVFYTGPGPYPITISAAAANMTFVGSAGDVLGASVDHIEDITGDSIPELLMGATQRVNDNNGYVQIRSGASGTLLRILSGHIADGGFGYSLRAAGDVNADGMPDVIVGAWIGDYAKVFSADDGTELHAFAGEHPNSAFGGMVSGGGDINNDGYDDLLVGAPTYYDGVKAQAGKAYVYSGQSGAELYSIVGAERSDLLGWAVDGVGDINHDGHDDFAVGSPRHDYSTTTAGAVLVYSGLDGSLIHQFDGYHGWDWFGRDICGAADLNGDGARELLVGSFRLMQTELNQGGVDAYELADADRDGLLDGCDLCPVSITGDVNEDFLLTSADIIYLVTYVFKGGIAPRPCIYAGNVNNDIQVTSADIIYLVNHVFKGGPPPLDVCAMIEAGILICAW